MSLTTNLSLVIRYFFQYCFKVKVWGPDILKSILSRFTNSLISFTQYYNDTNEYKRVKRKRDIISSLVLTNNPTEAGSGQFALWVAFFEIYNECVYDLLQPSLCSKSKKRASLRVCDDGAGNAYVKGVSLVFRV